MENIEEISYTIRPANKNDIDNIQQVLNHKDIIGLLGGFTMADVLKGKLQKNERTAVSLWLAECNNTKEVVGAMMVAGRPQSHLVKYGEVGVLPMFRRQKIGSCLYIAITAQGILEGRRLYEDTIVGDNPTQFNVLPTLGLEIAGELRHKTASAKSIFVFQYSLLDENKFEQMFSRIPKNINIEIISSLYTDDLFAKNLDIYKKHSPHFIDRIHRYKETICNNKQIQIVRQEKSEHVRKKLSALFEE